MHTPTKTQWNTVIENFKSILPLVEKSGERHLNMMEPSVNNNHTCGTVHCYAGWYAVATLDLENKILSYTDGKQKLAEDLGFRTDRELQDWTDDNPEIWGNQRGPAMFTSTEAFDYANSIPDIILFLEKVRDRSPD